MQIDCQNQNEVVGCGQAIIWLGKTLAFVDLPIAFLLISNMEQSILGIVAFGALRTN
jgi:hypothetical protein